MFGVSCENKCNCENGATCDPTTGTCMCPLGYIGPTCSEPCPRGYTGQGCRHVCKCRNEATCDPENGRCLCPPGYHGDRCQFSKCLILHQAVNICKKELHKKNAECILYRVILLILNRMWWKQFWQGLQWKLQLFWKWSLWPGDRSMSLWPWLDGGQVRSAVSIGKVWAGLCPLLCVSEQWVMWPSERMLQLPARVLWTELWIQYATLLP